MPVYEELKDRLEDMLEECMNEKIKPNDIEAIKEVVETIYKLNGIIMAEEYGEYRNYGDNMPANSGNTYSRSYNARGRSARRDSRGRYRGRYGHDKDDMIMDLEMKMQNLSGEDQDVMRRAINIIERG